MPGVVIPKSADTAPRNTDAHYGFHPRFQVHAHQTQGTASRRVQSHTTGKMRWHESTRRNANINNVLFHLLSYRELESSYTSVNPVPKKPLGKTRYFRDNRWRTLRSLEYEQTVFDEYKQLVTALIDKADARISDLRHNIYHRRRHENTPAPR